jgi:hypothetical protein
MFELYHYITIGGKKFSGINEVEIKRSITSLTGTAKIKVPSTAVLKRIDGTKLNIMTAQAVNKGDAVLIQLGYNGKLKTEFCGYVSRVNYTRPLEIECEDGVYLLKQKKIAKSYKDTTLAAVLSDIVEGTGITIDTGDLEINISKLILATEHGGEVPREDAITEVLSRYGLVGYFDTTNTLFIGLRQGKKAGTAKFKLGWNTVSDDELKYHNADDEKIQINAVYVDKLGVRTEVKVGDSDGSVRTVFLTDVKDANQLKTLAQNELAKYKFNGFSGKITAFLQPFCEPGYVANISDPNYSERSGDYYCEGIEVSYGTSGGRRIVEIGAKV